MRLNNAYIPYGGYWSSPFFRWQGPIAQLPALEAAAQVTRRALAARRIAPEAFDGLVLGMTIPQRHGFYAAPWLAGLIGAPGLTGPTIAQACATSARVLATAAMQVETGELSCVLGLACDRTSNGPHIYYPNPQGIGGRGDTEEWVWDNFGHDPWAQNSMLQTAEKLAAEAGIGRAEQEEATRIRYAQYADALAQDRRFQRRYLVGIDIKRGKETILLDADDGVHPTTAEGLAKLRAVVEGGTVTYGTQTHPADGNAGMVVCTREAARRLAPGAPVTIRLRSCATARVGQGLMPAAPVPAARAALERAGLKVGDCAVIKTHNPFAVNDVYFSREMAVDLAQVNPYGSPLVYGHPQAPTGLRCVMELIEALVEKGGGRGLFTGCAAGDSAMALVLEVGD